MEQRSIVGKLLNHLRSIVETDDHGLAVGRHFVDQLVRAPLGFVEACGRDVGGRHAGRIVDEKDKPIADELAAAPAGAEQCQHSQQQ